MQQSPLVEPPEGGPPEPPEGGPPAPPEGGPPAPPGPTRPSQARPFIVGVLGLLVGVPLALALEALAGGDGRVSQGFFVAAAALAPVIALGLLAQLVAVLAGRTHGLLRVLKRWSEEMAAEPPELDEETRRERRAVWEDAGGFVHVLTPFVTALALQLVATEIVAIYCIAADVHARAVAVGVGVEVFALFNYLLFFNPLLARLTRRGVPAASA